MPLKALIDFLKPRWDRDLFHVKPYAPNALTFGSYTFTIGTTPVLIVPENQRARRVMIQNSGLTVIKLGFGRIPPTQTIYNLALPACTVADDGTGGTFIEELFQQEIQAISSAAGGVVKVTVLA